MLLVGLSTTIYAADLAHDGADTSSDSVEVWHPVVETVLPLIPYVLLIVVALGLIGAGAYLKQAAPGGALR